MHIFNDTSLQMNETVTPVHLQSVTQTDGMAALWHDQSRRFFVVVRPASFSHIYQYD